MSVSIQSTALSGCSTSGNYKLNPQNRIYSRWIERIDYGIILPLLGRLHLLAGHNCSRMRGFIAYFLDYEWRSQAVGFKYIRQNTKMAYKHMIPGRKQVYYDWLTARRFAHFSREEWQAKLFSQKKIFQISENSNVEGLRSLLQANNAGRGVVTVSCHLDSFCMGMVLMGMKGLKISCVNTRAGVEDPRIHTSVTDFLKKKYQSMEKLMGGKMEYHETNMEYFFEVLRKGETVTLMGDVPGSRSTVYLDFVGKKIPVPLGAWKMSVATNSLLAAYVCIMNAPGRYTVHTLPPYAPNPDSPEKSMKPVYEFLEKFIRQYPSRWVAADIMEAYK